MTMRAQEIHRRLMKKAGVKSFHKLLSLFEANVSLKMSLKRMTDSDHQTLHPSQTTGIIKVMAHVMRIDRHERALTANNASGCFILEIPQ